MKAVAWIGADPGMSGALALITPRDHREFAALSETSQTPAMLSLYVEDMPHHDVAGKKTMDLWRLASILGNWTAMYDVKAATVERVHAMPKQGVTSSFSFGFSAGALQQALASAGIPITLVPPATWKAIYGLKGGRENKDMSRQKASQFYPAFAHLWARKKDDGRAEALLLARYGSQLRNA